MADVVSLLLQVVTAHVLCHPAGQVHTMPAKTSVYCLASKSVTSAPESVWKPGRETALFLSNVAFCSMCRNSASAI